MENGFTREDTKLIKGLAVILMLIHHLWAFPNRIAGDGLVSYLEMFGQSSIQYIGTFGKICVSIFLFLGGYGIYISCKDNKLNVLSKIKGLYLSYWKVFIIFIPIGFWFFSKQPIYCKQESICRKFSEFSIQEMLNNFLGIESTYNEEWWFLFTYVIAILLFPLMKRIIDRNSICVNIFIIVLLSILVQNVFPSLGKIEILGNLNSNYLYKVLFCQKAPYIACFWMGMLFAKENLLVNIHRQLRDLNLQNPLIDIMMIIVIIFLRNNAIGIVLDIIYVPFLIIYFLDILKNLKIVKKVFLCLGRQSTNMWLIHSFFCYYFYAVVKIVIFPKNAVLSLLVLIILSYIASIIIDGFYNICSKGWNRVKNINWDA